MKIPASLIGRQGFLFYTIEKPVGHSSATHSLLIAYRLNSDKVVMW